MITIHFNDTTIDVQESEDSYRYRSLMGRPQLVLKFSLPSYVEFPVGSWCEYQDERFVLKSAQNVRKNGTRNIEYNMTLGQDEDDLTLYKMRNSVDGRLKYSMCAKPHEIVEEIVKNLNQRTGGSIWRVGACIEAAEKTIEFNHSYIDDALQSAADLFETEWEIVDHAISLHKVEYFKEDPLPLSYGKGNGFIPGVGRTTQDGEQPIKRVYVQGGDKNIDRSKYGSAELLLPKGQTLEYEGRTYKSDKDGYYIERTDKVSDAVKEDSLDCSDIYPSRIGTVSGVATVNAEKNFYDFADSSIPENLDFNDYLIAGETATIIFQSGMLAGDDKEFEFKYYHESKDGKTARRFELVPQEIDGITMPNETYKPAIGDKYAVFGIMLPDEYICNNTNKTGASWDMFREAARKLYENEDQKFTFSGTLQGLWAKRHWLNIGGRLKVGSYILFSDEQFAKEGVPIRITGIKDYICSPYTPTIELSNSVSGKTVSSIINEIGNQEVVIDNTKRDILQFTKRRFRDAIETIEMLNDAMLDFSEAVNPIAVQTMAMLIGDESLQFRFVGGKESTTQVSFNITYDNKEKQLHCPHGFLQHMTIGVNSISSSHKISEYKTWEMSEYLSAKLLDGDKKYYLYAKVSSTSTDAKGVFLLSEKAIAMDGESGYYHLLVGVLNSEINEERSYVDLYGFTEILPGRITTERIVSPDGKTYFDLIKGEIGGNIQIKTGSSGYGNLSDKPDLSIYATSAELDVTNKEISAQVKRIDQVTNRIDTAGWITTADGNRLYASKDLENGNTLISYINQAAGSTTIHSNKINLEGAVTISALDSNLKNTINSKANSSDLGKLATQDAVEVAQLGSTIIVGGYLNTDYIKVNRIDANGAKVGGFTIDNGRLYWKAYDYFGGDSRSLKLGVSNSDTDGVVDVMFNAATTGRFGVKACGANMGGAAIYGSRNSSGQTYPNMNNSYAGYFDGGVHVNGNVYCNTILANEIGTRWSLDGGTYKYSKGMSGRANLDMYGATFLEFANGILVNGRF